MDWGLFYLCTCDSSTHHHTHDEQIIEISTYSSSIFHPSIEPCWAHTLQTGQKRPTTHCFPPALPSWLVYTHVSGDQRRQTSSSSSHLKAQRNLVQDSWQMALEKFMRLPTSPRAARDDPAGDTPASHHLQPSMLRAYSCLQHLGTAHRKPLPPKGNSFTTWLNEFQDTQGSVLVDKNKCSNPMWFPLLPLLLALHVLLQAGIAAPEQTLCPTFS